MTRSRVVRILAAAGAAAATLVGPAPSEEPRGTAAAYDRPITRTQVMVRALDWLRRDVAYSQDNGRAAWDLNRGRRYRPDCSGFVSIVDSSPRMSNRAQRRDSGAARHDLDPGGTARCRQSTRGQRERQGTGQDFPNLDHELPRHARADQTVRILLDSPGARDGFAR